MVVDHGEVAEPLGAGQRGRLGGDALLDVAVGGQHVDLVVEDRLALGRVGIEQAALAPGGHGHADGVGQALAERAGGDLHALGVAVLGVARRLGSPRPQRLEVVQLESPAAQVELDVQRQAGVTAGQHEPVPARPVRLGRVVPHHLLEQGVGHRRQAHGRAGMAVADLLHGVGGQHPDGVDRPGVQVRPALGQHESSRFGCRSRRLNPSESIPGWIPSDAQSRTVRTLPVGARGPDTGPASLGATCADQRRMQTLDRRVAGPGCAFGEAGHRLRRVTSIDVTGRVSTDDAAGLDSGLDARSRTAPVRVRDVVSAYVGLDQAADHRAAAGHDRAGHVPGRRWCAEPAPGGPDHDRRLPGRGQRERDQLRAGPRHRRADAPDPAPAAAAARHRPARRPSSSVWSSGVAATLWLGLLRQLAVRRSGAGGERLLRLRLHAVAQAADVAEHRLGRHRRLLPAVDRLDRRDRIGGLAAARPVRHRLLLDAAAHLGAGPALPRGLRRGRRADAAGRAVRAGGDRPDPDLLGDHRRGLAVAVAGGRHRLAVPGGGRGRRRAP